MTRSHLIDRRTCLREIGASLALPLAAAMLWSSICSATTLYVATDGNDAWSGALSKPNDSKTDGSFATLNRARNEIRKLKKTSGLPKEGVVVEVRGGIYQLTSPLLLETEDSGTESSPIIWRARAGEDVRLVGGLELTVFNPVSDPEVLKRLDESARGHVLQADLNALGVKKTMQTVSVGNDFRMELFFQDKPMTLARWPNAEYTRISDVEEAEKEAKPGEPRFSKTGRIVYDGDRPSRWLGEKDAWLHGFWAIDWKEERQRIESIDTARHIIALKPPYHSKGYRQGQGYYALNLLSELDMPGEWYHDRSSGMLYFWPPAPIDQGKAFVSLTPIIVHMHDIAHVTLRGLTLEVSQGPAISGRNVDHINIIGCTIRNTAQWAIELRGQNSRVAGCDMSEMGFGGVHLSGGDRKTLTPGSLVVENNHIHHYARWDHMVKPAIKMNGVGNIATHNLIDNAPHQAIWWTGNDHLIEFNEIHSVCYESNDAGAIYAGEDWTERGTVVRHNYIHHLSGFEGRGCLGVYLDDENSGTEVSGNVFYKVTNSVNAMKAAVSTCGRDTIITNNIFVDCHPAVEVSTRGAVWFDRLKAKLDQMPYQAPLWSSRYPKLVNILDDEPLAPKGNIIARNICVGGKWSSLIKLAEPLVAFESNLITDDPHFIDIERGNFQLKEDSPAWKLGFQRIPMEKIGIYENSERASWPVSHSVRSASATAAGHPLAPFSHRTSEPIASSSNGK